MKKILVFALVCIMAIACSPVEEGQEMLQAEPQAQQAPSLDPDKTYYAHFKVELQNNREVVLNSIELDASYWQADEQDRLMPDMARIQEELGFEALETLRGDSVKLSSVFIAAEEKLETSETRDGYTCIIDPHFGVDLPDCLCEEQLLFVLNRYLQIGYSMFPVVEVGGGWIFYCHYRFAYAFTFIPSSNMSVAAI